MYKYILIPVFFFFEVLEICLIFLDKESLLQRIAPPAPVVTILFPLKLKMPNGLSEAIKSEQNFTSDNSEFKVYPNEKIDFNTFEKSYISHPSTFIKKDLFINYGLYDESYTIAADHAFFFKIFSNFSIKYISLRNEIFSIHYEGGLSTNLSNFKLHSLERQRVLNSISDFYKPIFYNYNKRLKKINIKLLLKIFLNKISKKNYE
jgi:hypothetical protein